MEEFYEDLETFLNQDNHPDHVYARTYMGEHPFETAWAPPAHPTIATPLAPPRLLSPFRSPNSSHDRNDAGSPPPSLLSPFHTPEISKKHRRSSSGSPQPKPLQPPPKKPKLLHQIDRYPADPRNSRNPSPPPRPTTHYWINPTFKPVTETTYLSRKAQGLLSALAPRPEPLSPPKLYKLGSAFKPVSWDQFRRYEGKSPEAPTPEPLSPVESFILGSEGKGRELG